jgi:hypothetical protein
MQRRLTKDEVGRIGRAYDSLLGLTPKIDSTAAQVCRATLQDMLHHNTTDGLPYVEPPLTDEDARQRPWVMMRDTETEPWRGPRVLAACCGGDYYAFTPSACGIIGFRYCRRATPEEIAAAGLEVTE